MATIHVVQRGDTLEKITETHHITIKDLQQFNPQLTKSFPTCNLILYIKPFTYCRCSNHSMQDDDHHDLLVNQVHVTVSGERYLEIAENHHIDVKELLSINPKILTFKGDKVRLTKGTPCDCHLDHPFPETLAEYKELEETQKRILEELLNYSKFSLFDLGNNLWNKIPSSQILRDFIREIYLYVKKKIL